MINYLQIYMIFRKAALLIVLKQQRSSRQQQSPKTSHDDARFKEIVRFLLENWSFIRRRVTAELQCEIWWLTATLAPVPFLFEAAQFKGRMRFRVIIHERVSPCTGAGVRVSQYNQDKRLQLVETAEDGWRTQTEGVQWSLKVLLSVRWHLRAWPTGRTCHSPTCFYPYNSHRGPGSRWQITADTSWQKPAGETHPRGSKKASNEKILNFCGCVTWCPLKSCHVLIHTRATLLLFYHLFKLLEFKL